MNRRGFIAALLAAAVADPDRLLFVPGRKLISIAKPKLKKIIRVPVINKMAGVYGSWDDIVGIGRGALMEVTYELREVDADYEVDRNQVVVREFWPRTEYDKVFVTVGA